MTTVSMAIDLVDRGTYGMPGSPGNLDDVTVRQFGVVHVSTFFFTKAEGFAGPQRAQGPLQCPAYPRACRGFFVLTVGGEIESGLVARYQRLNSGLIAMDDGVSELDKFMALDIAATAV